MTAPERPTPFWCVSFQFTDWDDAGKAYEQSRDLIFSRNDDAAAYRVLLNSKAFVVIVGWGIPHQALVERLTDVCHVGEYAEIPDEVILTLALRHEQVRSHGARFERRSQL